MARGSDETRNFESPERWNDKWDGMLGHGHYAPWPHTDYVAAQQPGPVAGQMLFREPSVPVAAQPLQAPQVWPHPTVAPTIAVPLAAQPLQAPQVRRHPTSAPTSAVALAAQPLQAPQAWPHATCAPPVAVPLSHSMEHAHCAQAMLGDGGQPAGFLAEAARSETQGAERGAYCFGGTEAMSWQAGGSTDMEDFPGDDRRDLATRMAAQWRAQQMPPDATTIVMRNIPSTYSQGWLLEEFENHPRFPADPFDLFYVPTCVGNSQHKGFGFINFREPKLAFESMLNFHGYRPFGFVGNAGLNLSVAKDQGFEANLHLYMTSKNRRVKNAAFWPVIRANRET